MKKSVLIIGAGPAGLTCGYEISKSAAFDVKVVEISDQVGGMSKSITVFNRSVDLGPHRFFTKDERVNKIWDEIVGDDYCEIKRLTRIYYRKKFYFYPLKPLNALKNLGLKNGIHSFLSYLKVLFVPLKDESSFSNWVINRFGKRLYQIFFKNYTEKLWGIDPNQLSADFAKQRIKDFSLGKAIKHFIVPQKSKTLVERFKYPNKGNGFVYQKMQQAFESNGGAITFNKKITAIGFKDYKYHVTYTDDTNERFDYVISSMPLDDFLSVFKPTKKFDPLALSFRNTILVYLNIDQQNLFPDQWIYIHDNELLTGRITNFNNWSQDIINQQPGSVLALEYWTNQNDALWNKTNEELIEIATHDLLKSQLIKNKSEVHGGTIARITKCYPIYQTNYKAQLDAIQLELAQFPNLFHIGRGGAFKYNNQDHSILMGLLCAENIVLGENHNLWTINTDYEYQEEKK